MTWMSFVLGIGVGLGVAVFGLWVYEEQWRR
jgi:hypothetical protein